MKEKNLQRIAHQGGNSQTQRNHDENNHSTQEASHLSGRHNASSSSSTSGSLGTQRPSNQTVPPSRLTGNTTLPPRAREQGARDINDDYSNARQPLHDTSGCINRTNVDYRSHHSSNDDNLDEEPQEPELPLPSDDEEDELNSFDQEEGLINRGQRRSHTDAFGEDEEQQDIEQEQEEIVDNREHWHSTPRKYSVYFTLLTHIT